MMEDDNQSVSELIAPLSEVGYTRGNQDPGVVECENVEDANDANNGVVTGDSKWRMLLEQQNENFASLLRVMTAANSTNKLKLPEFTPDSTLMDARAWISTAEVCMGDKPLQGAQLMMALTNSLKGSASAWLAQVCLPGMTWSEFRDIFIARYDCSETLAAMLVKIQSSRPKEGENLASYAATLITSLLTRCQNVSNEQVVTAVVLAHISQFQPQMRRLAFTAPTVDRAQLLNELRAVTTVKRSSEPFGDEERGLPKRFKSASKAGPVKCFRCGGLGHKAAMCKRKLLRELPWNNTSTIVCYKCGKNGHISTKCTSNNKGNPSQHSENYAVQQINICTVAAPSGWMQQGGKKIPFIFDSGAECSLVKERMSEKLSGKQVKKIVKMIGIGHGSVYSTQQILAVVSIDGIVMEIVFHVVPDGALQYEVVLGRDILREGISVQMTSNEIKIDRVHCVYTYSREVWENCLKEVDTDVPPYAKLELVKMLNEFKDCFSFGVPRGTAKVEPMQIKLKDSNKTVCRRPYRLSENERRTVLGQIDELLKAGIIRPSLSPYASPILLVKKKDGTDRMCVDYRALNDNTVPDRFPLPLIMDQIDRLNGCYYFTTLDMISGYHQVPVHPESVEKTAFVTPDGHYEYLRMPFGLRNAPSVFQRAVIQVLGDLIRKYVVVYMDDILVIGTEDIEETLSRIRTVLKMLTEAGFSLNFKKCKFMKQKIEYLGFEVCMGEIRPNPKKIEALDSLPPPQTVTQLRQFIGLASYFRQFVPKFSQVMAPLYALTSINKISLDWQPVHEVIRKKIISILTNAPVLAIFNPQFDTELHTDASSIGYGAVLLQKTNKQVNVIAYFSKRTTSVESKYHSYELETLAVVNAVKHFRHYLYGRKFTVVTDCNALKSSCKKQDLTPRVHRWWAFLQAFEFDIVYKEGKRMCHADFFSRNPLPVKSKSVIEKVEQKQVQITDISENWLRAEQQRDSEISKVISAMTEKDPCSEISQTYEIRANILHRKIQRNGKTRCLPIIPRSYRWSVVNGAHDSLLHLGYEKTLDKLYDLYWFDHMAKFVKKFINNCITCKISKAHTGKIEAELHPIPKISIPWHTIHIDATGKLSGKSDRKEYVFVLIDAFTKFVILRNTKSIDSSSSIQALTFCISLFGAPARIIADQGGCFSSIGFRKFCKTHNIDLHLIATGSSRANGQVERIMGTLKNMMTVVESNKETSWQEALPDIQLALNCTTHRVTKSSPLELLIGRVARPLGLMTVTDDEPQVDLAEIRNQAKKNMDKSATYMKTRFDLAKRTPRQFKVGDFVLLKNEERNQTKLDAKYRGPFKVINILKGNRYTLSALDSKRIYKYAHDRLRAVPVNDQANDSDDDNVNEHVKINDNNDDDEYVSDCDNDIVNDKANDFDNDNVNEYVKNNDNNDNDEYVNDFDNDVC